VPVLRYRVDDRDRQVVKVTMMVPGLFPVHEGSPPRGKKGFDEGEVPVGAVVVDPAGSIVARAHNQPISSMILRPCGDSALRQAGIFYKNYRMEGATLVVTIEPVSCALGLPCMRGSPGWFFGSARSKIRGCRSVQCAGGS